MTWEDKITDNERQLMKKYQFYFDKNKRNNFTPYMKYWLDKMKELEQEIKQRRNQ